MSDRRNTIVVAVLLTTTVVAACVIVWPFAAQVQRVRRGEDSVKATGLAIQQHIQSLGSISSIAGAAHHMQCDLSRESVLVKGNALQLLTATVQGAKACAIHERVGVSERQRFEHAWQDAFHDPKLTIHFNKTRIHHTYTLPFYPIVASSDIQEMRLLEDRSGVDAAERGRITAMSTDTGPIVVVDGETVRAMAPSFAIKATPKSHALAFDGYTECTFDSTEVLRAAMAKADPVTPTVAAFRSTTNPPYTCAHHWASTIGTIPLQVCADALPQDDPASWYVALILSLVIELPIGVSAFILVKRRSRTDTLDYTPMLGDPPMPLA
jgi:hypothetical protein